MIPKLLHPYAKPAKDRDAYRNVVRTEGVRLWDDKGNEYIDALGSLWYCQVGYGRSEIIDAVTEQMKGMLYNCFDPWSKHMKRQLFRMFWSGSFLMILLHSFNFFLSTTRNSYNYFRLLIFPACS